MTHIRSAHAAIATSLCGGRRISTAFRSDAARMDDFLQELRGWAEIPGRNVSDDARRMIWLMNKAADEIERLRGLVASERIACAKIADSYAESTDGAWFLAQKIAKEIRARPIVTY